MSPQQLTFQLISSISKLLSKIWREGPFSKALHKAIAKYCDKSRPDPDSACNKASFEVPQVSVPKIRLNLVVRLISPDGKDIVKKPHSCHNSNLNGLLKGQLFSSRAFFWIRLLLSLYCLACRIINSLLGRSTNQKIIFTLIGFSHTAASWRSWFII